MPIPQLLLLALPRRYAFARGVVRGVKRYLEDNKLPWMVDFPEWNELADPNLCPMLARRLLAQKVEIKGVVAHVARPEHREILERTGLPVVNCSQKLDDSGFADVVSDDHQVGVMAADYFIRKGFVHFAYSGVESHHYSRLRYRGFSEHLEKNGFPLSMELHESYQTVSGRPFPYFTYIEDLCENLQSAKKPVALFCDTDHRAFRLIQAFRVVGLKVPREVAIIGVDNEEADTEASSRTLTSIEPGSEAMGYHAAQMIRNHDGKGPIPIATVRIPPVQVVCGQSTEVNLQQDPHLQKAINYLQNHYHESIRVEDVADHCGIGRRQLERLFKTHLAVSPHQEILRLRLHRAQNILLHHSWNMEKVAEACGFASPREFYLSFRRQTGLSPSAYRKMFLHHGVPAGKNFSAENIS